MLFDTQDEPIAVGQIDVPAAVERLIEKRSSRAPFVSPEGDEGAATAVLVGRELADGGLRTVLLDLTVTGAVTLPTLETLSKKGVTDLLCGTAQLTDVIHEDAFSTCSIMPIGTADPEQAMQSADKLPKVLNTLSDAYDIVLVECGPADADAIRSLIDGETDVLLSAVDGDEAIVEAEKDLRDHGLKQVPRVSPRLHQPGMPPEEGRSAA